MKSFIISLAILFGYVVFIIIYFNRYDYLPGNYNAAHTLLKSSDEKIQESLQFLASHMNIKNRLDLIRAINSESNSNDLHRHYNETDNDDIILHHNIIFQFDSLGNLDSISSVKMYGYSWLDSSDENYRPIISFVTQNTEYDNVNWGTMHFVWLISLSIIILSIAINIISRFLKKRKATYSSIITLASFGLLINCIHSMTKYQFELLRDTDTMIQIDQWASPKTLVKLMGINSHYNAIIFDFSIFFIVTIIITVFFWTRNIKNEV